MERTGTILRSFLHWAFGPASVNFLTLVVLDASHFQISNYAPVHFKDWIVQSSPSVNYSLLQHDGHFTLLASTQEGDHELFPAAIAADNAWQISWRCYRFIDGISDNLQPFQFCPFVTRLRAARHSFPP